METRRTPLPVWCSFLLLVGCGSPSEIASRTAAIAGETVGTLPGALTVDHDGTARYTIPIWVPPGRAGMEPKLALSYSSRSGNGLLGVGWSLAGLSEIRLCPKTVMEDNATRSIRFDGADPYCLDGARLVEIASGEYRTRPDSFRRVRMAGDDPIGTTHWLVETKDGLVLTYGSSADAIVQGRVDGHDVRLAWLLHRVEDQNGNVMIVSYQRSATSNEEVVGYRPARIVYTAAPGLLATREVLFDYFEDAANEQRAYVGGLAIETTVRMSGIRTLANGVLVRRYALDYLTSTSGRSLLDTVTACDGQDICLPPTKLTYTSGSVGWTHHSSRVGDGMTELSPLSAMAGALHFTDVDGDGRDDMLFWAASDAKWHLRLGTADGFDDELQTQHAIRSPPIPSGFHPGWVPPSLVHDFWLNGSVDLLTVHCHEPPTCNTQAFLWNPTERRLVSGTASPFVPDPSTWPSLLSFVDMHGAGEASTIVLANDDKLEIFPYFFPGSYKPANHPPLSGFGPFTEPSKSLVRDLDGDGQAELLLKGSIGSYVIARILAVNLGSEPPVTIEVFGNTGSFAPHSCNVLGDFNGDGALDALNLNTGSGHVFTGVGFVPIAPEPILDPLPDCEMNEDGGLRVVDVNGDGRDDILVVGKTTGDLEFLRYHPGRSAGDVGDAVFLGIGLQAPTVEIPLPFGGSTTFDWEDFGGSTTRLLDVNGDGQFDLFQMDAHDHYRLSIQEREPVDLLISVEDGLGAVESVTYATLRELGDVGRYSHDETSWIGPMHVVDTQTLRDREGSAAVVEHEYKNAKVNRAGAGFLGFSLHEVFDRATATTVTTDLCQDRPTTTHPCLGESEDWPLARAGLPYRTTTWTDLGGGKWLGSRTELGLTIQETFEDKTYFVHAATELTQTYEGPESQPTVFANATIPKTSRTQVTSTVDEYGTITNAVIERTVDSGSLTTTISHPSIENRIDTNTWLLGLIKEERITSQEGTATRTRVTGIAYDSKGNVASVTRQPGGPPTEEREATFTRNSYGLLETIVVNGSGTSRTTQLAYDSDFLNPTSLINPLNHEQALLWNDALGVVRVTHDVANYLVTNYDYDGFGRLTRVVHPDNTEETITRTSDAQRPFIVRTTSTGDPSVTVAYDKVGREVRRVLERNPFLIQDTSYDVVGRLATVTRPEALAPLTMAAFAYDKAGRLRFVSRSYEGHAVEYRYDGNAVDVFNEDCVATPPPGNNVCPLPTPPSPCVRRRLEYDMAGRMVAARRYPAGENGLPVTMTYEYGPFDLPEQVTDPHGNAVTQVFDDLGRPIELHDADLGLTTTTYDAFDQVRTVTRPGVTGPVVTTHEYDALGRLRFRHAPDGTDELIYDTGAGAGVGLLAETRRGDVREVLGYDQLGRIAQVRRIIDSEIFDTDFSYDPQGRPHRVTYPPAPGESQRFALERAYDAQGDVAEIRALTGQTCAADLECGAQGPMAVCVSGTCQAPVWTLLEADRDGRAVREQLGNGLVTTNSFDVTTGRLLQTATSGSPYYPHLAGYAYSPGGNMLSRTTRLVGAPYSDAMRTESFAYDGAGRMACAATDLHLHEYEYDEIDNLVSETEDYPGCLRNYGAAGGARPHALTSITCNGAAPFEVQHDPAGNVASYGNGMIEIDYSSFAMPTEITNVHGKLKYTYDASHQRVKRETVETYGNPVPWYDRSGVWGSTLYLGDYERRTKDATEEHVYSLRIGGSLVAQRTWTWDGVSGTERWQYMHADALGSPERATDAWGGTVETTSFDPWGGRRDFWWEDQIVPAVPHDLRLAFGGHPIDDENGLVFMGARVYGSGFKQFLQPDTIIPDPTNGAAWNRYAYAYNNPTRYLDPTGHSPEDPVATISTTYTPSDGGGGSAIVIVGNPVTVINGVASFVDGLFKGSTSSRPRAVFLHPAGAGDGRDTSGFDTRFVSRNRAEAVGLCSLYTCYAHGGGGPPGQARPPSRNSRRAQGRLPPPRVGNDVMGPVASGKVGFVTPTAAGPQRVVTRANDPTYQQTPRRSIDRDGRISTVFPRVEELRPIVWGAPTESVNPYSAGFSVRLSSSSYPGVSRGRHAQEANEQLLRAMETNAEFNAQMRELGINLQRTATGLAPRDPPTNWTWHHTAEPGVLHLVPQPQHAPGSAWYNALHPQGRGGYSIWGKVKP